MNWPQIGIFLHLSKSCKKNLRLIFISSLRRSPARFPSLPLVRTGLLAICGTLLATPSQADTFHPFISAGVNYDDNLFRVPTDQLRLTSDGADTSRSVIGGVGFERPVSRQIFTGAVSFSSMKFDRNSQLDYVGKDFNGEWHWFVGSHFEGHIGASSAQVLAPFADFHSVQRNLRTTKRQYADANWLFHPSWRWRNSYEEYKYIYDLPSQSINDRNDNSLISGIDYLAKNGSTVGFQFRRLKDSYPRGQALDNGPFSSGYVQDEAKLNIMWAATGTTQIFFLGGWVQRKRDESGNTVDKGTNARLIVNSSPRARLKLGLQAWHEFAPIDGALVDSALTTGVSGDMTWDFSAKIQGVATLARETRKFTPATAEAAALASALLSDSRNSATVGVAYKPLRNTTMKLNAFRDQRSGSLAAGTNSYSANGVSFNVIQQF